MWERWNGDKMISDPQMNSFNHYAYGAVADWIYRYAGGIDATPSDPGFHTIVLQPHFDQKLGSLSFTYDSAYGSIRSEWVVKGAAAEWRITIPANTTGWLDQDYAPDFKLNGKPLNRAWLRHAEVAAGGVLDLEMGPKPNESWGSAPDELPPRNFPASPASPRYETSRR